MNSYNANQSQNPTYSFNHPVNQQGAQQKRAFGSSYEQAQRQGFLSRQQSEHVRPPAMATLPTRNNAMMGAYQAGNIYPSKMRRVESAEQVQARYHQQTQMGFGEATQVQVQPQPRTQTLRYNNGPEEESPASQESVNALAQACLTTPLDEDEARLLAPGKINDNQNSSQIPHTKPSSGPIRMPPPTLQGHPGSQFPNRQGLPSSSQNVMSSAPKSSSPIPFQEPALETKLGAIEAKIEQLRLKFHYEIRDLFIELKTELKQLNLDKSDTNSK